MILLIRHCKPKIDYTKCGYAEAVKRVNEYNHTHNIDLTEITPLKVDLEAFFSEGNSMVFTSSMPRALLTAQEIFGKKFKVIGDDKFIEFDLKLLRLPFVHLKFGTWALISRIAWFIGFTDTKRSFPEERLRAKQCAEFLYDKAQGVSVALVAHGMLNTFIENHLKNNGYKRVSKVNNGFFAITKLIKTT